MKKEEFYFQWHFMNSCNLRCAHCYQEGYHFEDMDLKQLLQVAKEISKALSKWNMLGRLSLTGGEPFLSPYLFDLIDYIESDDNIKQFDILTNGTYITDKHIERLKVVTKLRQIQISLDGPTQETHDLIRGSGAFNKVVETVKLLQKHNFEISFMFTLMRQNKSDAVKIIDFADECGVNAVTVERVTPCGHSNISDALNKGE
ncbi:MAG: radical SAM protein, partial [Clostridiales bacterium]|nr:radical SAM protein [Clostridiales bacterium]